MTDYEKRLREEVQEEINEISPASVRNVANLFCDLTNEQRQEVMCLCCKYCGTLAQPCNCENDE